MAVLRKAVWSVLGAALAACTSSDYCTNYQSAIRALATQASACPTDGGSPVDSGIAVDCETVIINGTACGAVDLETLDSAGNGYARCVAKLPACTAPAFAQSLAACQAALVLPLYDGGVDGGVFGAIHPSCQSELAAVNLYP